MQHILYSIYNMYFILYKLFFQQESYVLYLYDSQLWPRATAFWWVGSINVSIIHVLLFRKVRHKGAVAPISEAKRFYDRVVRKFGLSLRVPVSEYVHSEGPHTATLPYLKPSDLLRTILSDYSFLLFGGCSEPHDDIQKLLLSFWRAYQVEHPEHEVFKNPERWNVPFP